MKHPQKYMLALLLLALLAGLVEDFRAFFLTNIVEPIAVVCWAIWRIIASVDQKVYWIVLIAFCCILVIRLIPTGSDHQSNAAYSYKYRPPSRVEYWKALITNAGNGNEEINDLRDSLQKLLISAVGQAEMLDPIELEERAARGKAPLSPQAQRFLFPPQGHGPTFPVGHRFNVLPFIPGWLRTRARKFRQRDTALVDEILGWIEKEMEIDNDK